VLDPDTLAAHEERIARDGYTILEGVIERELRNALTDDLVRLERFYDVTPSDNGFEGTKTVRIYNLLALGKLYEGIPVHPNVLPVVDGVLDDGCLVSSLSSITICPNETAQPIHADDQLIPLTKPHVPTVCNTMWALTDFTEANGATRIIPGSHLRDHSPDFGAPYDSIAAEMPAGSVLVWHGSLWHGVRDGRSRHRLPKPSGWNPGSRRNPRRHGDLRQSRRRWIAHRHSRRQYEVHGRPGWRRLEIW